MIKANTIVQTTLASRYLVQLCKHFAHKITVEYDPQQGRANFPWGVCIMSADDHRLEIHCEAPTEEDMERVKFVVTDHLQRFGWKEKITVAWQAE